MQTPVWLKPGLTGAAVGAVAMAIVGFSWGGWVTGGTAEEMASTRAKAEVVGALVPFCVAQSNADPLSSTVNAEMLKASSYQRADILMKAGWATMPGASEGNRDLARACALELTAAG